MSTFRAFAKSESYAEYRQNLEYLIMSVHEGFKKLFGFDPKKREMTYWNRAIMQFVKQSGDASLLEEAERVEEKLEILLHEPILNDEDMIVAFTHMGTLKKLKKEVPNVVLDYYTKPIKQEDLNALTDFIYLMNDVLNLYNKVLDWENKQIKQETADKFSGYHSSIDRFEQIIKENVHDEVQLSSWKDTLCGLRGIISNFEKIGS